MNSPLVRRQNFSIGKAIAWTVMFLLVLLTTLIVSRYLSLDPGVFFPEQRAVYLAHLAILMMHIIGSMLALLIGLLLALGVHIV